MTEQEKSIKDTKPLAQKLGAILSKDNISNSYYNDEYYTPCKTSDLDKAYRELLWQKELTKENFDSSYPFKDKENGEYVDFPLKEIIKMVIAGDFDSQYKTTSSLEKNLETSLHLFNLTSTCFSEEEHEKFWSEKSPTPEDKKDDPIRSLNGREYQLEYLKRRSMANMVAKRFDFYSFKSKEELQIAHKLSKKLIKNKEFLDEVSTTYQIDACTRLINSAETEEEKKQTIKLLRETATNVKNKSYDKVAKLEHYDLRRISINNLLFGKSQDPYFDKLVDSLEGIEDLISKRGKLLDINI
jgi:hypothetical protein